jgi:hypothetical protein
MQIRIFDDGAGRGSTSGAGGGTAGRDCLFVLGWGNRCRHENVQWLVDRLTERFRVHVAELPTHITAVQREWVDPLESYAADLGSVALLCHSAGGLAGAHLDVEGIDQRVYLSPWWGSDFGPLADLVTVLPISKPVLPVGTLEAAALGDLATETQVAESPKRASPAFLETVDRAQRALPPARENAIAFCTLTDAIVDPRAVGRRLPADRIRLYDGGHELFSSTTRGTLADTVVTALERGPTAL